jgi:hypothetical protein
MIPGIWPGLYLFHRNHGEALKKTRRRLYSLPEQCGARVSGLWCIRCRALNKLSLLRSRVSCSDMARRQLRLADPGCPSVYFIADDRFGYPDSFRDILQFAAIFCDANFDNSAWPLRRLIIVTEQDPLKTRCTPISSPHLPNIIVRLKPTSDRSASISMRQYCIPNIHIKQSHHDLPFQTFTHVSHLTLRPQSLLLWLTRQLVLLLLRPSPPLSTPLQDLQRRLLLLSVPPSTLSFPPQWRRLPVSLGSPQ